jgi:hypothetical protein
VSASYSGSVAAFLAFDVQHLVARLALEDARRFRRNETQQVRAWEVTISTLRRELEDWPAAAEWRVLLEFPMRRLGRRIDCVLVTTRAVLVLEFKAGSKSFEATDRRQVEDYALDLQDFHAASRRHPIVPVLVATEATPGSAHWPLLLGGVTPVLDASAGSLAHLLRELWERLPESDLDVSAWERAPYRPVPGIVDAACTL